MKVGKLAIIFLNLLIVACDTDNVKVLDTEKPIIACQADINITVAATENGKAVTYTLPEVTDNVGATLVQTGGLATGAMYPVGSTVNTFQAKDAAGNTTTCSFNVVVTREVPTENKPYFIGNDPTPTGKKWAKIEALSDEFTGTVFNDAKWHRNPATDGFNWIGRPPALFEAENVTVSDGNLNVTTRKLTTPRTVNNLMFTHGGAIIRSKETAKPGNYYECRMKANSTIMSSTFWISFQQNCNTGPVRKLELDIQECVGRIHSKTNEGSKKFLNVFHSNAFRHSRPCDTGITTTQVATKFTELSEKNNSRFFVYGCWWKSPTEILFYLDGKYAYTITPTTDFDLEGYITMAIETYDWNPVEEDDSIFTKGTFDELTTKYDWVRTWKLEDK